MNVTTLVPIKRKKHSLSKLEYGFNWSKWLKDGDTITSSTWTTSDAVIGLGSHTNSTSIAMVWVGPGGVDGKPYTVTNTIITAQGRTELVHIIFTIDDTICDVAV